MFTTHAIRFNNRVTFDLAVAILHEENRSEFSWIINHDDMIIKLFKKFEFDCFISELAVHQIWDKPSFKGPADFVVQEN